MSAELGSHEGRCGSILFHADGLSLLEQSVQVSLGQSMFLLVFLILSLLPDRLLL